MRAGRFRFQNPGHYGLTIFILLVGAFMLVWRVGKNSAVSTVAPTITNDNYWPTLVEEVIVYE